MADQHNSNIPAAANQISADITDIKENLEFHKDVLQNFLAVWSDTDATGAFPKAARAALSSNTTLDKTHYYVECDTSGGAFTVTLPSAADSTINSGRRYIIKLATAGNALTIATNGSETIDSADAFALNFAGEWIEIASDGTNWQLIRWHFPREEQRAKFAWKDGDEIYIDGAVYRIPGGQYEWVYWNSQITFQLQSAGSNAASDDYGADGWHYIYIDDSAVDTQNTPLLDADCFLNDTTAPTWDHDKRGWYNGADRCIFAVYETGGAILEFFHDGTYVLYADEREDQAATDIDTTWTDITLSIPGFSTKAKVLFSTNYVDGGATAYWRTNGQTGTSGHEFGKTTSGTGYMYASVLVITDSSQIIEVKHSASNGNTITANTQGWYLPKGM